MSKLSAFVRLDTITIKPYMKAVNLLIFGAIAVYLSFMFGDISSGVCIGTMLGVLLVSYVFVISEKHNMDALYTTLAVGKNTVVAGRYMFTLLLNVCLVAASCALAAIRQLVFEQFNIPDNGGGGTVGGYLLMAAMLIAVQAIQLPIYFKLGYTKARFVSIFPFCVIFGGSFALDSISGEALDKVAGTNGLLAVCAGLIAIIVISYRLSVSFYKKREF